MLANFTKLPPSASPDTPPEVTNGVVELMIAVPVHGACSRVVVGAGLVLGWRLPVLTGRAGKCMTDAGVLTAGGAVLTDGIRVITTGYRVLRRARTVLRDSQLVLKDVKLVLRNGPPVLREHVRVLRDARSKC
jgi:hypothetical protein